MEFSLYSTFNLEFSQQSWEQHFLLLLFHFGFMVPKWFSTMTTQWMSIHIQSSQIVCGLIWWLWLIQILTSLELIPITIVLRVLKWSRHGQLSRVCLWSVYSWLLFLSLTFWLQLLMMLTLKIKKSRQLRNQRPNFHSSVIDGLSEELFAEVSKMSNISLLLLKRKMKMMTKNK